MGCPPASVSRPSANRLDPYGTTADRRGLSRLERSQALSFTKRLAPRPLGCEPFSVVTVHGVGASLVPGGVGDRGLDGVRAVGELGGVEGEGVRRSAGRA